MLQITAIAFIRSLRYEEVVYRGAQIAQVRDIEKSTRATIQSDLAHLQLLNAKTKVALPPVNANADPQAVDKLIDQKSQLRAEMEKAFALAEVQLQQIMGKDNFDKFFHRYSRRMLEEAFSGREWVISEMAR